MYTLFITGATLTSYTGLSKKIALKLARQACLGFKSVQVYNNTSKKMFTITLKDFLK